MSSMNRLFRCLGALALAVLAVPVLTVPVLAQPQYPIEGYINVVRSQTIFEVDGRRFFISPETRFGLIGPGSASTASPLREALRIGAYVQVDGVDSAGMQPIIATTVLIRDERNRSLSGIGVITRVVSDAPNAVFEADGYLIRITPSTKLAFMGGLSSLAEVSTNTWLNFNGKRGKDGVVDAVKAQFIPGKPTKFKAVKDFEIPQVRTRPSGAKDTAMTSKATGTPALPDDGASLKEDEQLKIGIGRWHTLPADQPTQQRLHRIGMALIPAYQREMADDNPSKIHFRFFVVDNNKWRGAVCLLDGAVLVSQQTIERLNDDQLAAVAADGVACNLQRQTARRVVAMRKDLGIDLALDAPGAFVPVVAVAALLGPASVFTGTGPGVITGDEMAKMTEERLRIALALMHDAGFDPWQAPEAWRLALPKKVPANPAVLPYPDSSCYQMGILGIEYGGERAGKDVAR